MSMIKGKRSVFQALKSSSKIERIVIDHAVKQQSDMISITRFAQNKGIKVQILSSKQFQIQCQEPFSQGIIAYLQVENMLSMQTIETDPDKYPFLVIVDHIQDPYNFGAILRSCECFGVSAVLYPKDRNCQLTAGVTKASSGAATILPLVRVTNLSTTLKTLKSVGYTLYGADMTNGKPITDVSPIFPAALVVGNEAKGISQKISQQLDQHVYIPMSGQIESLNVSVACSIIVFSFSNL